MPAAQRQRGNSGSTPASTYREAVIHAREIRKRYSALDLAADADFLDEFAAGES